MNTKNRQLFLVVTDLPLTLDYLNKKVRRVLYIRFIWELRKSAKQIIQCHNCHSTTNSGRPPRCLKCAGDHSTRSCTKIRDTAITCVGRIPANYSKCRYYIERKKVWRILKVALSMIIWTRIATKRIAMPTIRTK